MVSVFVKVDFFFLYVRHFYKCIFIQDSKVAGLAWQIKDLYFNGKPKNVKLLQHCQRNVPIKWKLASVDLKFLNITRETVDLFLYECFSELLFCARVSL